METKMLICSVHDSAVDVFMNPFFVRSEAECERIVFGSVADENSLFKKHPQDYNVYMIGYFDPDSGELSPVNPYVLISSKTLLMHVKQAMNGGQPHSDPRQIDLED